MSGNPDFDWELDDDDTPPDQEDDLDELNCGLCDDGQCMSAGTEYCDFECPYRDSELFAGSEAWNRKHKKKEEPDAA